MPWLGKLTSAGPALVAACFLAGPMGPAQGATPWAVKDAPLRLTLKLGVPPSIASAGYVVVIPDGGTLPKPAPEFVALDSKGKRLPAEVLWHDSRDGLALVVGAPQQLEAQIEVYVRRAAKLKAWSPRSSLTPGVFSYVMPGGQSVGDAARLRRRFPPGEGVLFMRVPGFEIGAIPQGLDGSFSDYLSGYLVTKDPGRTWLAVEPTGGGTMEIHVEGRKLMPKQQFPQKSGSTGGWLSMTNLPYHVEMYTHRPSPQARLRLAWRPPHATGKELGGDNPLHKGKSMWAARPIRQDECAISGKAGIESLEWQDGRPVASFASAPKGYVWLKSERPVIVCQLEARTADNPAEAHYLWTVGEGLTRQGIKSLLWLVEGGRDQLPGLTVRSSRGESHCRRLVRSFCSGDIGMSMNRRGDRLQIRRAMMDMLEAVPSGRDPATILSAAHLELIGHLVAPDEGQELVARLMERHWQYAAKWFSVPQRQKLEDFYVRALASRDARRALAWVIARTRAEPDSKRAAHWRIVQLELLIFYLDELESARQLGTSLIREQSSASPTARLRMADAAFLEGDLDKAARYYGALQEGVDHMAEVGSDRPRRRRFRSQSEGEEIENWRVGVVRDTAISVKTRNLIRQRAFDEAWRALKEWELEFPLSKLSGDYFVVEALYFMGTGDYEWPVRTLTAYCRAMEVSSALPEAVDAVLECMLRTGRSDEEIQTFVDEIKKRFKYHPVGAEIEGRLENLRKQIRRERS